AASKDVPHRVHHGPGDDLPIKISGLGIKGDPVTTLDQVSRPIDGALSRRSTCHDALLSIPTCNAAHSQLLRQQVGSEAPGASWSPSPVRARGWRAHW